MNITGRTCYNRSAISPRTQWISTICIGKHLSTSSIFSFMRKTRINKDIHMTYFTNGRSFKKTESLTLSFCRVTKSIIIHPIRHHIFYHFCSGFQSTHSCRIQLGTIRFIKSPISIDPTIVINQHCRVKTNKSGFSHIHKRPFGSLRNSHIRSWCPLFIRIQIISFNTIFYHFRHIGSKHQSRVFGIIVVCINYPIIPPITQIFQRCGPNDQVCTAIFISPCIM